MDVKRSVFLENESSRASEFKHNEGLIKLIKEMQLILEPIQERKNLEYAETRWPIGLVIGAPRSGTTLLFQWIASLGSFSYPSNLMTRFAYAPYIGSMVQKMLFDPEFDFHGDFEDLRSEVNFSSNLGMSKGALATNSFNHFFRAHLPNYDPRYLYPDELEVVDHQGIISGLASIEDVFRKPFITKGMMLQYNIDFFAKKIPKLIFFHIKRDPLMNMQSLLIARKRYFGDSDKWYSARPKEYEILREMDRYHQVAGQIYYTNRSIEDQLNKLSGNRWIKVEYEDFCNDPKTLYEDIRSKYAEHDQDIGKKYNGIKGFSVSHKKRIPKEELDRLSKAYEYFIGRDGDSHIENQ